MTESLSKNTHQPIAIVGGGIIGLAVGWQLVRRGQRVVLFEKKRSGRAASWVAAGMLAPHSEVGFEEEDFLRLGMESLREYPRFLQELEQDTGRHVPLDKRGTLIVGLDRDDSARLRRLYEYRRHLGLPVEWLVGSAVRDIEPLLSPRVTSAIWLPDDGQVNNRDLVEALREGFARLGGELREDCAVTAIHCDNGCAHAVEAAGETHAVRTVILAAGCWSNQIDGIPEGIRPPVRPVKGQLVSLRMNDDMNLTHVIRAPDVYLIPKDDGRLVLGASQEEMGFDTTATAGPVLRLLQRGWEAVPSIYELAIDDIEVGLRPGSHDHQPIIGATEIEGLYYATGHHRHGILLAPFTAYAMCDLIIDGNERESLARIRPTRFGARQHPGKVTAE